ncbi:aminoglycoside phosphotransferase family protein [Halobacillus sp. Marseille-Q1614]|uniref:aminoglycoside phosphotransferase family protein n=1 Tax=Halobacillus sp. Marseille-Q1614 TaxID=2709134 RepID=UPI00156F4955|nr:aminoglycoside phosphotransferase family protein [Halobacillus sp. Marseille-Q1614]
MKNKTKEGDSYTDRLFNWLDYSKDFSIKRYIEIKPKIYKVRAGDEDYLLKGYHRSRVLKQQLNFFRCWKEGYRLAALPVHFPNGERSISKHGCEWGLFKWVNGKHADFTSQNDRVKAYECLRQFHRTSKGIEVESIPRDPLYLKWKRRLAQFRETRPIFKEAKKLRLYEELAALTSAYLESFSEYPWGEIEEKAWESRQWLHGDVAHHNFIIDKNGLAKLIDFDLLHRGPELYDDIQLAHRFLPHLEDNRSRFFLTFRHVNYQKIWLHGVLIPADLLREWLYVYNRDRYDEKNIYTHLVKLETAWERRKRFVRYTEFMLR